MMSSWWGRLGDGTRVFLWDDSGVAVLEFSLISGLLAVTCVVMETPFGSNLSTFFRAALEAARGA